ncbi:MAG: hypothetical protein KDA64_18570 [Rhodospirillaceae bacterium]|nr:hypothetical protein [Rhodospirillaceae bacterium]
MTFFACDLEARAGRLARAYHVVVSKDLFGMIVVEVTFGRIGTVGRMLRFAEPEIGPARTKLRQVLLRRLSAPHRLGTAYRCRQLYDPSGWLAADRLDFPA